MILLAASVVLLAVIARGLDRLAATPGESRATKLTRMLLWAIATLVAVQAALGAAGWLDARATLIALGVLAAVVLVATRRRPRLSPEIREPLAVADAALIGALIAAIAPGLLKGLHRTTFLYDALSYHLHEPVTWMHAHRLEIVPAVFGDPSPAYAPSNLELVFLFLMAPLRSDFLAGVGQLPFALLAVAAIVAAVREAGGKRAAGLAAALAFVLIPEVWGQRATAMTDLGLAACLLASLPFARRLWRAQMPERGDLLAFAVAIGLTVGSKYAGAALAAPVLATAAIMLARRRRRIAPREGALALAALLVTGGFWYLRNLIATGNPFYPVAVPGLPLPALYGGAEMRAWDYHVPVTDLFALGALVGGAGLGFGVGAVIAVARQRLTFEIGLFAGLVTVFWFAIPYQESRFLFTAFGVVAIVIARVVDKPPALVGWCALGAAIGGSLLEWPTSERLFVVPAGAAAALAFSLARRVWPRGGAFATRALIAAGAIAVSLALAAGHRRYEQHDPGYNVGDQGQARAWAWFRANVRDARVAYTGSNVAFPLAGERLSNHVSYVNVAGALGDRLHDFGPPGDGTPEPAPYRRGASADAWLANLRAARTQVLFVAALDPGVRRTIAADGEGFPIERAWADARPAAFHLRYATADTRVYAVELP